ncbi:acetyl-CoA synthetase-like protein [Meredithblackwellia eburnea MCA 4105]
MSFRPRLPGGLSTSYTPLNPLTFLLKAANIRPDHPAIIHPEKNVQWTYRQWAERVKDFACALQASGIKEGDRVMLIAPNVPFMADGLQAIGAVKAIVVPVNIRLTAEEVAYIISHSGPKLILIDRQFANLLPSPLPSGVRAIVCEDSYTKDDEYEKFLKEGRDFDLKKGAKGWEGLEWQADELATYAISYTSGTTSRPKGVETSFRGTYLAGIANAVESGLTGKSVYLWILPMFHCLGWCFPYACTMAMATQICLRQVGDYSEVWKSFLERGVTHYSGAPTVQLSIASHAMARRLPKPIYTTVAGAAPSATLIKNCESHGIEVCHVYGLTETYGPSTRTYFEDKLDPSYFDMKARQGFSFLAADDMRVVKLIPEGKEGDVKEGDLVETKWDGVEVGEIVFRGNIVMKGYYNDPVATRKAFAGGYFHTGDLAVRFPDGTFNIADRSKDLIISGGENISSLAVEAALQAHPDVHEVAVVARAHEKWGERPHAFVILKPSSSSKWKGKDDAFAKDLKGFVKGTIAPFAVPEWIELVDELEKTSTGKVQKKALRDKLKTRLARDSSGSAKAKL